MVKAFSLQMTSIPQGTPYPGIPEIRVAEPVGQSDSLFYFDGSKVIGPHTSGEISQLFHSGVLKSETQICTANNHEWKNLKDFPDLTKVRPKGNRLVKGDEQGGGDQDVAPGSDAPDDVTMIKPGSNAGLDGETINIEKRLAPIKTIRSLLDDLWEAQRESIIAHIKNEELDERFEMKRKGHLETKERLRDLVVEYWRRGGVLDEWINDLITQGKNGEWGGFIKKFKQNDVHGNFERTLAWLDESGLGEKAGVYSFEKDKQRIYVGESERLEKRLRQHQGYFAWGEATHIRILIPKRKANRDKLERMMILRHLPADNGNEGKSVSGSKADDVLEIISEEINDLLTDG